MRGKGPESAVVLAHEGITPAYAGKSRPCFGSQAAAKDHPRVCGEKFRLRGRTFSKLGSPPRMRGKDAVAVAGCIELGITPAYAGKSNYSCDKGGNNWDHPRVCGEKYQLLRMGYAVVGSPPRMRGKGPDDIETPVSAGITPAYAGKRLKRSRSTVPHAAIVPLFPSVCNKPAESDDSPAGHDAPPFLPIENAAPASPAYNLRSL
mgnify:CR=1 FL=1